MRDLKALKQLIDAGIISKDEMKRMIVDDYDGSIKTDYLMSSIAQQMVDSGSDISDALRYIHYNMPKSADEFGKSQMDWEGLQHSINKQYSDAIDSTRDELEERRRAGRCPICGELGKFINLGLTCSIHGGY